MQRLSAIDASWFQMDEPGNAADITVLIEFAEDITLPELEELLQERFIERYPRFRQRVRRKGVSLYWQEDPHFALSRHVEEMTMERGPGAMETLVGDLASRPLREDRPLWEMMLVHDPRGGGALVARLHHCLGDGFGLGAAFLRLTDKSPDGEAVVEEEPEPNEHPGLRERLVNEMHEIREHPEHAAELARMGGQLTKSLGELVLMSFDPDTPLHGELSGVRRVAWTRSTSLDRVKQIGRKMGATLNDILVAAMSGALRRWLEEHADGPPVDIRAIVPVNLRAARSLEEVSDDLGNKFGLVILDLFTSEPDPHERLAKLKAKMDSLKESAEAVVAFGILNFSGAGPAVVEHMISHVFTRKASVVVTNVPGPRQALYLAGREIENIVFWVPHPGLFGLGMSIISYNGQVRVGIRADTAIVAKPELLAELFEMELDALEAAELGSD